MTGRHELAALQRLMKLCAAGRDLALQDQGIAERALEEARVTRMRGEEAIALAEREWRDALVSPVLAPEHAAIAAGTLIARATTLGLAVDCEARAQRELESAKGARVAAEARVRQMDARHATLSRKARHRSDERALARAEDRATLYQRQT